MPSMRHLLPIAALALSGCEMQSSEDAKIVASLSACEKVLALVDQHPKKFDKIALNPRASRRMTIWEARYHLVGKNCQVWGWGKGKTNYMCSQTAPSKELAIEHFTKAKQLTQSCLGADWSLTERPRKLGTGVKAVFSQPNRPTVVSVHAVETKGLFKEEWTAYFFVGDSNEEI